MTSPPCLTPSESETGTPEPNLGLPGAFQPTWCRWCGSDLPTPKRVGRPRKFCSPNCAKDHWDDIRKSEVAS